MYKSIASKGFFAYLIEINLHLINIWLFPFFEHDFKVWKKQYFFVRYYLNQIKDEHPLAMCFGLSTMRQDPYTIIECRF